MINTSGPGNTAFAASSLCQDCGLCCMGALHSYIRVSAQEEDHIRNAGISLRKAKDGKLYFVPPCVCLKNNKCSIHATKPAVCQDYHCILQKNVMNGSETVDEALRIVTIVKQSAEKLKQQVTPPKNREITDLNLRHFLFSFFDEIEKVRMKRDLTSKEQVFIYDAFEYAKLVDRYFLKTLLLTKYSDLIVKLAAETEAPPSSSALPAKP